VVGSPCSWTPGLGLRVWLPSPRTLPTAPVRHPIEFIVNMSRTPFWTMDSPPTPLFFPLVSETRSVVSGTPSSPPSELRRPPSTSPQRPHGQLRSSDSSQYPSSVPRLREL